MRARFLATGLTLLLVLGAGLAPISPARAQALPPPQAGAVAQDPELHRLYLAQPSGNVVLVLSDRTLGLLAVLKLPPSPAGIAVDSTRHRVYVTSDAAGLLTVVDGQSGHVLAQLPIDGHPAAITLLRGGKVLLVTDGTNGAVWRVPALPHLGEPAQILSVGPRGSPEVLFAPQAAAAGAQALFWSRGFAPHEPVKVYWGVTLLQQVNADETGAVAARLRVPRSVALGTHLVVLIGQWSTRSNSALLRVIPAPPPKPARAAPPAQRGLPPMLQRLLTPRIAIAVPAIAARGPLQKLRDPSTSPSMPMMILEVALLLACSWLLLRVGRRRGRARRARTNRPSPAPPAGPPLKRAA